MAKSGGFAMADKLVFSTENGGKQKNNKKPSTSKSDGGPIRMRLEKKGRGGKSVTVLFNLPFDKAEAKSLMKDLQAHLACGATFKDGQIELRGDYRDKIIPLCAKKNLTVVKSGS